MPSEADTGGIEWETDDWPKTCACGYTAEDERDAISHAITEHREWCVEAETDRVSQ